MFTTSIMGVWKWKKGVVVSSFEELMQVVELQVELIEHYRKIRDAQKQLIEDLGEQNALLKQKIALLEGVESD